VSAGVQRYLVESYVPRLAEAECHVAASRARSVADELSRNGTSVRYLHSLFLAEDETCFHVFEAPSVEAVAEASRRAELAHSRIVPVSFVRRRARPTGASERHR
jgi:hypothetical protein